MLDLSNKDALYMRYRIRKANGGWRQISAPCPELKELQKQLATVLSYRCLDRISCCAFGFRKGYSIVDAARLHVKKDWILNVDIKNFFPSIHSGLLTFLTSREIEIATLDNGLAQGSPCSPIISNIVMFKHDEYFRDIFGKCGITYTRYADDITLSGNTTIFKNKVVEFIGAKLACDNLIINPKKTKYMPKHHKQEVLGIVVNDGISISRHTRKRLRAAIHQGNITEKEEGLLAYIQMVNNHQFDSLDKGR